jgi:hypothetical protein
MQYRETINRKLEAIDGCLRKLDFILKRQGTKEEFFQVVEEIKSLNEEIKSYISRENTTGNEINRV